ncbi:T9SS type A sorting domain-containing protein [Adhaeribacter terreus]|uniref:T9SS type A sorting domain-containing protein n=1 Tax=Adhaeribacter terreus TaxID=529703 RepID=A0ABW0EGJ1_9BACT
MANNYFTSLRKWLLAGMFLSAYFGLPSDLKAQTTPAISWDKALGGGDGDNLTCFGQTSDGGFILGGNSASGIGGDKSQVHFGNGDFWIVKTDANGNKIWDKTFGGSAYDMLVAVHQTSDGGYILGGYSNSPVSGNKTSPYRGGGYDYWVVKTDANGSKVWDKSFGDSGWDQLAALAPTSDGGYLLAGESDSPMSANKTQASKGSADYWLVKIDANGNKSWDKTIGGSSGDYLTTLKAAPGGFILGGYSGSNVSGDKTQGSQGSYDFWLVKINTAGSKVWDKTYGGPQEERLRRILPTSDGGYLIGGSSYSNTGGDKTSPTKGYIDMWVLKLNGQGNKTWDKAYGGGDEDVLTDIAELPSGELIFSGYSRSGITGDKTEAVRGGNDYWLVKTDNSGNKLWDKTIGGNLYEFGGHLIQTSDGSLLIGGYSESYPSGEKTSPGNGENDMWLVKLAGTVSGTSAPNTPEAVSIRPNPSSGKFLLTANVLPSAKTQLIITDLAGRLILQKELNQANGFMQEELKVNARPGIYLLTLKAGNRNLVRKLIIE